jgi:hypothetical protein
MKKKAEAPAQKPKPKRTIPKIVYDLSHARHEPGQCHASIFRSLPKGTKRTSKLDITYKFGKESLRFVSFEILGVDDMRFFQVFVALAGPSESFVRLDGSAKTDLGKLLATALNPTNDAQNMYARIVKKTSFYRVLKEAGYDPEQKKNIENLKRSLFRLSNVSLQVNSTERIFSIHLMSYEIDKATNELSIALNPLVTESITGKRRYTWIDLNEVRSLKTDPARILHERLCAWIDRGKTKQVSLDKILGYIYPDKATENTIRKRRYTARKALQEIADTGWKIEESSKGICTITRPKVLYINEEKTEENKASEES